MRLEMERRGAFVTTSCFFVCAQSRVVLIFELLLTSGCDVSSEERALGTEEKKIWEDQLSSELGARAGGIIGN